LWDDQPEYAEPPLPLEGDADHYDHRLEEDHWEQPGNLFRKMTPEQKQRLFDNTARAINGGSRAVMERHVANCRKADPAYGAGVAQALGVKIEDIAASRETDHVAAD
jgi:catalase